GDDKLTGGAGDDTISGGDGNDHVRGGPGADTLNGDAGNDSLDGGAAVDALNGGAGDDVFDEEASPSGGDTLIGGLGVDLVDYSARTANLTVSMDGAAADDGAANENDNIKADVENILCGSGNDDITGNTLANRITAGDGNDVMRGGGGNDTFVEGTLANGGDSIEGGLGVDLVDYSGRTADLTVTMGDDLANDGALNEHDDIAADVENLRAGSGNDQLTGNALANSIQGGLGNDTLGGNEGDDTLDGTDRSGATNDISCGPGADVALNAGSGAIAVDCELHGI
ncbi:MAG TPA: calcium-binding protein, partial [Polyangiales bacterium]|nr:calcium-binding protein [Polyangiales bacterium]